MAEFTTRLARAGCRVAVLSCIFVSLLAGPSSAGETAKPLIPLKVVLNFTADGALGGFYHALARGYYRDAGLDVSFDFSNGSADAITRVASGLYDIGVGDIATLVEFAAKNRETAPRAVYLLYNKFPAVIVAMKSSGIEKPADLQGRVLGQGPSDGASRMFPALANLAGVDISKVERRQITPRLRDSMLITRQVDAVTGFDHTVWFNLKAAGTRFEDVKLIYYADYGLDVYGNAILASRKMLKTDPDLVARFVRASSLGWREAIADPKLGVAILRKFNEVADLDLEAERLDWLGSRLIVTPYTRREGIGAYDRARLAENIKQVTSAFGLAQAPKLEDIYDDRFLPPRDERLPLK
jgi:NitT/TauT family transport system substrate-binding protein